MLALTSTRTATDAALRKIACAYLSQPYPLTEEGQSVKEDVARVLALGDIAWLRGNVHLLPTVEHPKLGKYFTELNFGDLGAEVVLGPKLIVIQTHEGCSHVCEGFCDSNAPYKIVSRMPYAGIIRLGIEKHLYDRRMSRVVYNWYKSMRRIGLVEKDERDIDKKIRSMDGKEFYRFACEVEAAYLAHPVADYFSRWPLTENTSLQDIWTHYRHYVPVMLGSLRKNLLTFNGNDPMEYADPYFLHLDGTPADYGDVFKYLSSPMRPIFISTAGWSQYNVLANRSVGKILNWVKKDDWLSAGVRLSIKRHEKLARGNPQEYLANLKRIIDMFWPLGKESFFAVIYYAHRLIGEEEWALDIKKALENYTQIRYGEKLSIDLAAMSCRRGKAYDPEWADQDHDPGGDVWGYHIYPDGGVYLQGDPDWRNYQIGHETIRRFESVYSGHEFTGVKLW